ncbi:MAG: class II fructose-bisphosphate aldolase family protein [Candidatus Taylorbacteria bacterium]|nr:class II fructose-bisphosphate aldolase family protein [Candidatus Taylorbacteria bacterium]
MKTLREYIHEARENGKAIGHFNISNLEAFNAIVSSAKKLNVPVIIGVSEGERDFVGITQVVSLVKGIREKTGQPVFLNADHTYSFERVKEAIDAGFDMVITDDAKGSFEENLSMTRKAVEYAKMVNERDGTDILVEAEIGYIGASSKLLDGAPEGIKLNDDGTIASECLTKPEDAARFVRETGIDLLAPAVGNIHGVITGGNPKLDINRIASIAASAGVPLVLHGASGIANEELSAAVSAGVSMVHYNTELRVAYKEGLQAALNENEKEIAPYKFLKLSVQKIEEVVTEKLKIMNRI